MIEFRIINDPDKIKSEEVLRLLKMTYWANNRTIEQIEESMASSFCYGLFLAEEERLVGFARVISDLATTYYLCDVIIDPEYQHQGLGKALVSHIVSPLNTVSYVGSFWQRMLMDFMRNLDSKP